MFGVVLESRSWGNRSSADPCSRRIEGVVIGRAENEDSGRRAVALRIPAGQAAREAFFTALLPQGRRQSFSRLRAGSIRLACDHKKQTRIGCLEPQVTISCS